MPTPPGGTPTARRRGRPAPVACGQRIAYEEGDGPPRNLYSSEPEGESRSRLRIPGAVVDRDLQTVARAGSPRRSPIARASMAVTPAVDCGPPALSRLARQLEEALIVPLPCHQGSVLSVGLRKSAELRVFRDVGARKDLVMKTAAVRQLHNDRKLSGCEWSRTVAAFGPREAALLPRLAQPSAAGRARSKAGLRRCAFEMQKSQYARGRRQHPRNGRAHRRGASNDRQGSALAGPRHRRAPRCPV